MADDPTKPDPAAGDPPADPQGDPAKTAEDTEALKGALEKERKARREAEKAAKTASDELAAAKAASDTSKSDLEKLTERLASVEANLSGAEKRALRAEVASEKGLPPELAARLQGDIREELEADAEVLLKFAGTDGARDGGPGSWGGGQRGGSVPQGTSTQDMSALLRRVAGRG